MKLFQAILFLLVLMAGFCQQSGQLLIVRQSQSYGLIDTAGAVVLQPQFFEINHDRTFNVFVVTGPSGKAVFSPVANSLVTGFYDDVEVISSERFVVTSGGLSGVADQSGNLIIPVKYTSIRKAGNGKYFCANGNSIDVYNSKGAFDIEIASDEVIEYSGFYIFKNRDFRFGVVSPNGDAVIKDKYDNYITVNGLIELRNNDSTAILHTASGKVIRFGADSRAKFIIDGINSFDATPFYLTSSVSGKQWHSVYSEKNLEMDLSEADITATAINDYFIVNTGYYWLLSKEGIPLTVEKYEELFYFRDSIFVIGMGGLRGLYRPGVGEILGPVYKSFRTMIDTVTGHKWTAALTNPDGYMLLDDNFRKVNDNLFIGINLIDGRGIIAGLMSGNVMLLLDTAGKRICDPVYSLIRPLPEGLWKVYNNGFCGVMDSQGKVLTELVYDDITFRNSRLKCTKGGLIEFFRWDGSTLEPLMNFSNYRRLEVSGMQATSLIGTAGSQLALVWRRDSVLKKFGLYDVVNERYVVPPMYDYAKMDQLRDISLTGIYGDTSYFRVGPLTFMGRIRFGVIDHKTSRIIAPSEFMFVYFNHFQRHFLETNRNAVTAYYNTDRNFAVAIDTAGNWRTVSYTGATYRPSVQYIDAMRGNAKVWRFDSCYVAEKKQKSTDKRICNVSAAFAPLTTFLKPADGFTIAAMKNKKLFIFSPDADSLVLQKGLAGRLDPGLNNIPIGNARPLFVYKYSYPSILEAQIQRYCNMLTFVSRRMQYYIDSTGYVITDSIYPRVLPFSEDLAMVKKGSRYGYIDRDGNMVIENKFRKASSFSEGKATATIKGGRFGYIGTDGEWLIEPAYREALDFSEGLAPVKPGNLFGYIDETGSVVIKPAWLRASLFINGTAVVFNKDGFGLIDRSGKELLKCRYNRITPPDTNNNRIISRKSSQLVNAEGKIITKKSKVISDAGEGYYSIKSGQCFSLIRADGTEVARYNSDRPLLVGNDKVLVTKKNRFYYYDLAGNKLMGPYNKAASFAQNLAVVSTKDETYVIDTTGKIQLILYRSRLAATSAFDENGLAAIRQGTLFKLIDKTGKEYYSGTIKPRYAGNQIYILNRDGCYIFNFKTGISYPFSKWSDISMPSCGRFIATASGLYGFSDVYGQYHISPQFTRIERMQQGIYRVHYLDRTGYFRFDGKVIWELSR